MGSYSSRGYGLCVDPGCPRDPPPDRQKIACAWAHSNFSQQAIAARSVGAGVQEGLEVGDLAVEVTGRGLWWIGEAIRSAREDLTWHQYYPTSACTKMLILTPFPLVDAVQGDVFMLLRQPNQGEDDIELIPSQFGAATGGQHSLEYFRLRVTWDVAIGQ